MRASHLCAKEARGQQHLPAAPMAGARMRAYVHLFSSFQGDVDMRPAHAILNACVAGLVLASGAALTPSALAADPTPVKAMAASTRAVGTITAIDMAGRHVTLRNSAQGEEETFSRRQVRASRARAKIGDQVQARLFGGRPPSR